MNKPPTRPDINMRVGQYIKLRDEIKRLDDEHKTKMEPYRKTLENLNTVLVNHLNAIKAENVRTEHGTVYKSEKRSATIADGSVFWDFVVGNQAFDLIDRRANTTAVYDYIETHKQPPPGINTRSVFVVGVRRS